MDEKVGRDEGNYDRLVLGGELPGAVYLLVMDKLFADFTGVEPIQATAAFSCPAVVLRLEAVVDEAPLNTYVRHR